MWHLNNIKKFRKYSFLDYIVPFVGALLLTNIAGAAKTASRSLSGYSLITTRPVNEMGSSMVSKLLNMLTDLYYGETFVAKLTQRGIIINCYLIMAENNL